MKNNLKLYNIMSRYSNPRTTRAGPPMVVADLPNGCESTACYIAQTFYNCCRNEITKINNRNQLRDFFIKSQRFWMPPELTERGENRHFDQVLYALVNDGGVCRVKKTEDGSHRVTWGINNFQRPRNQPRKRINVPNKKRKTNPVDEADIRSDLTLDDFDNDRGLPLTMEDLQTDEPLNMSDLDTELGEIIPLHQQDTTPY